MHYEYDELGRLETIREKRPGSQEVTTSYKYDAFSRVRKVTYPTGFTIRKIYNEYGYLKKITSNDYTPLWKTVDVNEFGQVVDYKLGDNILNRRQFDNTHRLVCSAAKVNDNIIQSFSYSYDDFSNLAGRTDNKRNLEETFTYDDLNRLTSITLNNVESQMVYDDYGRVISKQTDGQTVFSAAQYAFYDQGGHLKPHAISSATMPTDPFPTQTQSITYTMFDKVKTITQGNRELTYQYGYDHQRIRMEEKLDNQMVATKEYYGNIEIVNQGNPVTYTYLSGPLGTFAVVKHILNSDEVSFILKDHLGSWTAITDYDGDIEQELSFDAWGNLRNPTTWSDPFVGTPLLDRGYTSHEHLYDFGLINMNGRMYDPVMSSFLSVDNYIQQPDNSQNFNRYAYCLNNPLKYTDPTGEDFVAAALIIAGIGGAYAGGVLANNDYNPINWDYGSTKTWGYMAGGALVGATSAYVGLCVAGLDIPMCNTLSYMACSTLNSIGTYLYTGGQANITVSFGVASIIYSPKNNSIDFGYPFKKGNGILDNIGYIFGAFYNFTDVYRLITWDVKSYYERCELVKEATGHSEDDCVSYISNLPNDDYACYWPDDNEITLADPSLKNGRAWAKSSLDHEWNHLERYDPQAVRAGEYSKSIDEFYANLTELNNANSNGLSYKQYRHIVNQIFRYGREANAEAWGNYMVSIMKDPSLLNQASYMINFSNSFVYVPPMPGYTFKMYLSWLKSFYRF